MVSGSGAKVLVEGFAADAHVARDGRLAFTGGNAAVIKATGAKLLAHHGAKDKIPGIDRSVADGDVFEFIIKMDHTTFQEAVERMAAKIGFSTGESTRSSGFSARMRQS